MPSSPQPVKTTHAAEPAADDHALLAHTADALEQAGLTLRERYSPDARPATLEEMMTDLAANDAAVLDQLKPRLLAARPGARWVQDELEGGLLPPGEWWVVDPAEGNVNHVHGMTEWALTATLVRDNQPVLTAVHLPLTGHTYTAAAGRGAHLNGRPLRVSAKTSLAAGIAATSQARPGEDEQTLRRIGESITAMLLGALLVRVSVPATLHLVNLAAGHIDAFWQFNGARADLLPGALLVTEAGGRITDAHGAVWTPASDGFLAAAPGIHAQALARLSS
jgi:myo-inositol-1(or 4)-monophosphatase